MILANQPKTGGTRSASWPARAIAASDAQPTIRARADFASPRSRPPIWPTSPPCGDGVRIKAEKTELLNDFIDTVIDLYGL
jgi:hypothetical protein